MTMHAMELPGYQPHTTTCGYCQGDLGLVRRPVPLRNAWKEALKAGPDAIKAHQTEHNADAGMRHKTGCPFRELPPAVHDLCETWEQLLRARKDLDDALGRDGSPTEPDDA
ncbi:hypothetical protein OG331_20060 [Streptomyces sp. NBC_01017]|uniref:hypothetical protein n=1 Tax=Streptomyces sp. NBC_01017 TaxID=2903721 RepID=UPI003870A22B|nr:hypothetical protein OG331_20060 [Streptomyces sp. NBC_01017]